MPDYSALQSTVRRILGEFDGRTTQMYLSNASGSVSSTTGAWVDGSTTTTNVTGIVGNYTLGQVDGVNIIKGDLRVVITDQAVSGLGINSSIVIDGNNYSIVSVQPINPGGTILGYILQVRR